MHPGSARKSVIGPVLAAVVVLAPLPAAPATAVTKAAQSYAGAAFSTTNDVRHDRDRVRLKPSPCLQKFANRQARKLAKSGTLKHQDLGPILDACQLSLAGENLALGYSTGAKAVKQGWMKSKGHRKNLLEQRYRRMAIAARKTDDGRWVAVQLFGRKA